MISCQTGGPSSSPRFWKEFCKLWATVSLTSVPPRMSRLNISAKSWKHAFNVWCHRTRLLGARTCCGGEYAHNSLPTSATSMSPFKCVFSYQASVFSEAEREITVLSAHAMVRRWHGIWATVRKIPLCSVARMKRAADRRRRPAMVYQPGQKVWLSTQDLPLHVISRKLPRSLRVHQTFHISWVKTVRSAP